MLDPSEILFMGIGRSAVLWYRCALPAINIGADWVGTYGEPPAVQVLTGIVKGDTQLPQYEDYKVVVLQQPWGKKWLEQIHSLKARGIKVLFEVDDYLHGVGKQKNHDFAQFFTKDRLRLYEMCMRVCDGIICSTEYIARRYAKFNRNIYICKNGLDLKRYDLTRPKRSTVNIGWAGATGHLDAIVPWLNALVPVLQRHEETCIVFIGSPQLAQPVNQLLSGGRRALGIPFTQIECYPAAMCMFDIALGPGGTTSWYRGKSDLRWLEAGALGVPIVADANVYPDIEDGVNGFQVVSPEEAAECVETLVEDSARRIEMGEAARDYVERQRSADIAAAQWFEVCSAVAGEYESVSQLRLKSRS